MGSVSTSFSFVVQPAVSPPPPPPPPPGGSIVYSAAPTDGYVSGLIGLIDLNYIHPNVIRGQRISGTVTISPIVINHADQPANMANFASVVRRLLIDNVPQASWTIDTTQFTNGPHVLGVQIMNPTSPPTLENGSRIVVFNNSASPIQSRLRQPVVGPAFLSGWRNSLAFAWVDVRYNQPYPIGHDEAKHPPPTDADVPRLATGSVWWIEGLTHQGTMLYGGYPSLVKNANGDYFVRHWNPQNGVTSEDSKPANDSWPQYDGPRGIAMMSPYATLIPSTKKFASGYTGFVGVDISGRLMEVEISGQVATIFGPRSIPDAVQTDPTLKTMTLAQRIAAGEKELVGNGPTFLTMPQDCSEAPDGDTIIVADTLAPQPSGTGTGMVHRVSRSKQMIVSSSPRGKVSSVWCGFGVEWWVCPRGLWKFDGTAGTLVAPAPNFFWVRGDETRRAVYVLAKNMELFEFNVDSGAIVSRIPPQFPGKNPDGTPVNYHDFCFMAVDHGRVAGPRGRIYYSMPTSYDSNKGIHYTDPGDWIDKSWNPGVRQTSGPTPYVSVQASNDKFGHYIWGLAFHQDEALWVSVGISNTSWKIATAHLGVQPPLDPTLPDSVFLGGEPLFRVGKRDVWLGLGSIFGFAAAGSGLGWSVDEMRNSTLAEFQKWIDPMFPSDFTAAQRQAAAYWMWSNRSRTHFPA